MHCPYCGTAVAPGAERCERCGIAIRWEGEEATFEPPGEFVTVFTAWDPAALPVVESLLESNGIPYLVANDVIQDMFSWGRFIGGFNPVFGPPVVKVPELHADAARAMLVDLASVPAPGSPEPPA